MLAARGAEIEDLKFPLYASPKLDGIRAVVKGGKLLSRKLTEIPNRFTFKHFSRKYFEGADGELIVGPATDPQVRNLTSGSMNRREGEPDVYLYVFDLWDRKTGFRERNAELSRWTEDERIVVVPQHLITVREELERYEKDTLDLGYEGVILRSIDGLYKFGRSTLREGGMLKLKRFVDAEAQVLRVNEEMQNTNEAERDNLGRTKRSKAQAGMVGKGRAGELEVIDLNGDFKGVEHIVPLGAAGDKGKAEWWARRNDAKLPIITYKYFPKGTKDKPLLPIYVGVREEWDSTV